MITIQTNKRQRNILIFDNVFNLEENNDFTSEMFDAIFILTSSVDDAKSILNIVNPITSNKCIYKPFIASKYLKGKLDEYDELIDHYANDIDDVETLDIVDGIINRANQIQLYPDNKKIISGNLFFIRLYRYLISRHVLRITPQINEMYSMGYSVPILELFHRLNAFNLNDYIMFNQYLLEKGYIHVVKFINRIYLCPKCLHSHLLYVESCPNCKSSAIKSEAVIHHFRCANVSPEHTYNFGGQLRCPKCHQLLRHIGVDYDRPSEVYTCANCEETFLQPQMTAICTSCMTSNDVSELTPFDINELEITPEGSAAILSPNIGFTVYADFYDNYMEFNRFIGRLQLHANLVNAKETDMIPQVIKIWMLDDNNETCMPAPEFIALICKNFPTYMISSSNNMVYIKNTIYGTSKDDWRNKEITNRLDDLLNEASFSIRVNERICYAIASATGKIEDFIKSLKYVSPFPDKVFIFSQKEEKLTLSDDPSNEEPAVEGEANPETEVEPEDSFTPDTLKKESARFPLKYVLIICLSIVVLVIIFLQFCGRKTESEQVQSTDTVSSMTQEGTHTLQISSNVGYENTDSVHEERVDAPKAVSEPEIGYMEHEMYYIVTAAFQNADNAFKQRNMNAEKHPQYTYRIYRMGSYYIVSPFCSENYDECRRFISSEKVFSNSWITKGKKGGDL